MNRRTTGNPVLNKVPSQRRIRQIVIVLSGMLLGACGNNQMAYFNGSDHSQSVSLVREQVYLSGPWQTTLVVGADPLCQRRYPLEELSGDQLKIDVYQPETGVYILDTGKRWYVTELQSCEFQAYKRPPPAPGELIGSFKAENGALSYLNMAASRNSGTNAPAQATVR